MCSVYDKKKIFSDSRKVCWGPVSWPLSEEDCQQSRLGGEKMTSLGISTPSVTACCAISLKEEDKSRVTTRFHTNTKSFSHGEKTGRLAFGGQKGEKVY